MKPTVVNHGNVFKTGNWYTFYCGKCKGQLFPQQHKCKSCGTNFEWNKEQGE